MAQTLSVVYEFASALQLCCYYFVVDVLEVLARSDGSMALQVYRTETVSRVDGQLENVNNGDETRVQDGEATQVTFRRRGDRSRNNLRELRKQQRSMKMKYYDNSENLLYYCFYKGITDKYYKALQKC